MAFVVDVFSKRIFWRREVHAQCRTQGESVQVVEHGVTGLPRTEETLEAMG